MPKKRGRPEVDDFSVFLRMKERQEQNPSLSDREIAEEIATTLPGVASTHIERLRKRFGRLKHQNKLLDPDELLVEEVRSLAEYRQNLLVQSLPALRKNLAEAEREAQEAGLPTASPELEKAIEDLKTKRNEFSRLGDLSPRMAVVTLSNSGINDPDEVAKLYREAKSGLKECDKNLDLAASVDEHRRQLDVALFYLSPAFKDVGNNSPDDGQ